MACSRVAAEAVAERYLAGELTEDEQSAFERHYFECDRCFDELGTLRAVQTELRSARALPADRAREWRMPWLALAASVMAVAGAGLWWWASRPTSPESSNAAATPVTIPTSTPAPPVAPDREKPNLLAELARFDPPPYRAPTLRTLEDTARAQYREAMQHYLRREYAAAITLLRASTKADPAAADAAFFLGVSLLLADRTDQGVAELRRAIAMGDSPYLEESQYYLAKGLLKRGDTNAAREALRAMIALAGDRQREGKTLLSQIDRASAGR
jgi:TolA-binding protein